MDTCHLVRESLSARADGEEAVLPVVSCDEHVAGCAECRAFAMRLDPLVRASRVQAATDVPDLTAQILVAAGEQAAREGSHRREQLRWTLGLVGVAQALLALVSLFGDAGHISRDLATWQLALGVAFVVAAWQPHRGKGLLPMVGVLGFAAMVSAIGDVLTGSTTFAAEMAHLVEVAGVGLVWGVARLSDDDGSVHVAATR